jgi:hypothetical protein
MFTSEHGEYATKATGILSRQPHIMSIRICETFATTVGAEWIQRKYFTIFVNDIPLCYRIESQ